MPMGKDPNLNSFPVLSQAYKRGGYDPSTRSICLRIGEPAKSHDFSINQIYNSISEMQRGFYTQSLIYILSRHERNSRKKSKDCINRRSVFPKLNLVGLVCRYVVTFCRIPNAICNTRI